MEFRKGVCIDANVKFLNGLIQRECSVVSAAVATPSDQIVEFATGPGDGRAATWRNCGG